MSFCNGNALIIVTSFPSKEQVALVFKFNKPTQVKPSPNKGNSIGNSILIFPISMKNDNNRSYHYLKRALDKKKMYSPHAY